MSKSLASSESLSAGTDSQASRSPTSQPPAAGTPPGRKPGPFRRAPACTHTTVMRERGTNRRCDVCGLVPSMPFIYVCQQDYVTEAREHAEIHQQLEKKEENSLPPIPSNSDNIWKHHAGYAKSCGVSDDIVRQICNGIYTVEQIDILVTQRQNVIKTIKQQVDGCGQRLVAEMDRKLAKNSPDARAPPPTTDEIIALAGSDLATSLRLACVELVAKSSPGKTGDRDASEDGNSPAKKSKVPRKRKSGPKAVSTGKCDWAVCHTCRPSLADRLVMSLNGIPKDDFVEPVVDEHEISNLPIADANIMRTIGLRKTAPGDVNPQQISPAAAQEAEDEVELSDFSNPPSSFWSDDLVELPATPDSHLCPGAGVCPEKGCAYDTGSDDGHRAVNHECPPTNEGAETSPTVARAHHTRKHALKTPSTSTISSVSLPDLLTEPLTPTSSQLHLGSPSGKAASVCGIIAHGEPGYGLPSFLVHGNDSSSSLGSEVEVQGGVALTEEAVVARTPDLITD